MKGCARWYNFQPRKKEVEKIEKPWIGHGVQEELCKCMTTLNILSEDEDSLMQDIHERDEVRQLKVKIEAEVKLAGQSPFFK